MAARDDVLILPSGRRIGYRLVGADDPARLVYLHGRPGGRAEIGFYDENLLVERGLCAIAVDRPGYGWTDPLEALDPLSRAQDVLELLTFLDLRDLTVQGMSGGGMAALAAAVLAPDRVRAVVLTSSAGLNDPDGTFDGYPPGYLEELLRERDDRAGARRDAEAFAEALRENPVATFEQLTSHWPPDERALLAAKPEVVIEDSHQAIANAGLGYFVDNMSSWQPWPEEFDAVTVPVHVFHGENDQWSPIWLLRQSLSRLPDIRWTTYDGDHFSPFLTPERQGAMLDLACR